MSKLNGKLITAVGAGVALAALVVFGLAAPATTIGQETDVPPGDTPHTATLGVDGNVFGSGQEIDVTVNVLQENGTAAAGVSCVFSIVSQPGDDATVDPGPVTTDSNGNATTTLNVGTTAGELIIGANCDGVVDFVSVAVDSSAGGGDGGSASPPGSLPDSGTGPGSAVAVNSGKAGLVALLAGIGMALAAAGVLLGRVGRPARYEA